MPIPESAFTEILAELARKPLGVNHYRVRTGDGRSQCFGVVNKRCLPPDYSRQNWLRPYLYKLLLDFGNTYITDISWNAITVNQNYKAGPHYDRGNDGPSVLVGCGDYKGGYLQIHEGPLEGLHCIRHTLFQTDFSKTLHSVTDWSGNRVSLVFYKRKDTPTDLPPASVELEGGKWVFKRGGVVCRGLPHPLKKI